MGRLLFRIFNKIIAMGESGNEKITLEFKNKYVAFIDVLGFSELVKQDNSESLLKLKIYFYCIKEAFKIIEQNTVPFINIEKFLISDSIILIANDSEEDFFYLLRSIRYIQAYLAWNDIWIRGGIAYGPVYYNEIDNIIVGNGFINAYNLEKEAIYPRVIISPNIITKMGFNLTDFKNKCNKVDVLKLIHDSESHLIPDDAIFVSYAYKIIMDSLNKKGNFENSNLTKVFYHLKKNLYGEQKHYSKYLWLKKYFNDTLAEIANYNTPVENIDRFNMHRGHFANL